MRMVDICIKEMGKMSSFTQKKVTLEDVYRDVVNVFNLSEKEFKGKCRDREFVIPRQIFCYLSCMYCSVKLDEVGSYIGGRDHTTVIHARDTAIKHIKSNDLIFGTYWNRYTRLSKVWDLLSQNLLLK